MYQRIVCFRFKADTSSDAIRAHMDSFKQLKDAIPQIVSYSGGRVLRDPSDSPPEYHSMHYLTFNSLADINTYHDHAAHQRFIETNKAIWEKVLVLNAAIAD